MCSEKAVFGYLFSFPFPHFHDHWYALRGCRNTWWLTGGAPYGGRRGCALPFFPRLLFSFSSPGLHFFRRQPGPCWNCPPSDLMPGARLERPSRLNPSALSHPPRLPSLFTAEALQRCCSSLKRWRP